MERPPSLYRPARNSTYNFVSPRTPSRSSPRHTYDDTGISATVLDAIVAGVLEAWAIRLGQEESSSFSLDPASSGHEAVGSPTVADRVRKLWQAVVRQSHDVASPHALPNPICTAICVEILVEVLHVVLPRHSGLAEVLIGGLVHSIYATYDPSKSYYANNMYAHAGQDKSTVSVVQATVRMIYTLYSQLDPSTQRSVATDLVKPQVSTDMLGDLWDVLMGTLPTRDEAAGHMALLSRCFSSLRRHEKCQLLPQLASSFIPRRVEEFLPPTNSHQDPDDTFDVTPTASSPTTTGTHHTQPPPLCRRSQRGSNIFNPREYRKASSRLGKSSLVRGSHQLMVQRKPSEVRKGGTALGVAAFRRKSTRVHDVVLPPDQLHGILPLVGYHHHHHPRQSTAPPPLMTKPSLLVQYEDEPDTSAELLEFLDELADDLKEIYALLRVGEYRSQQSGMHDLAQLLTTRLHVTLDDDGMSDPKDKERTAVTTIVQMLKAHPSALGSVLKHVPDLVVDTLRVQQGILKYVMVHCSWVVGQFLKLDEVAADTWQAIVKAQSKKQLTLLWSTDQDAGTEEEEVVVSPVEAAYQWLQSHVTDTAKVLLLNHDMAKHIFAAMEREVELAAKGATNKGLRLKMLLTELDDLPTFQAHTHLATQKGFEMAMKHDMKGMVTLLTIILSNNTHLKDLVTSNVEVIAALAMHNKHALINLLNSDLVTWKPFFMQAMTQHAFLLTDCLMAKTKHLGGGDQLMVAYHSVLDGVAGRWVTDDADRSSGVTFKPRSHFTRAVSVLRIANRRGSRASSSEGTVEVVHATDGKDKRSMAGSPSVKRMASMRQRQMLDGVPRASVVPGVYHIPWIWKTFLIDAALERPTMQQDSWGRRELKRFILDILIEKIKLDELEIDEDVVSDLSVFVCDYLTTKLQNRSLVSFQLQQLVNGLQKHIEDPRVSFFAAACGVKQLLRRGVLHSCLRSLSHLLFGELRIFRQDKRLQELVDGSCVVPVAAVEAAARSVFAQCLSSEEMDVVVHQIASLRRFPASDISNELNHVDLDDAMAVYLQQWQQIEGHMDEQFILAFNRFRGANQDFVGIDQFVKIVTTVTRHGVSVRDCRLIFYDTGKEMIDLNTILRLMQEYDLRISLSHPKVMLDEADFDCIRQCLGVSSVLSFEDEFKQLVACWTEVKPKIDKQMASLHQTDETKRDLAYHLQAVEDSLAYLRSGIDTPSMNSTWETFRSSIASLQAAVNAQRSFSILYVQCHVRKWVSKLKRRKSERRSLMLQ